MRVFLSVIVPVYNAENTLRECVDSILSQSFCDFELILVDDGSKDSSPQLCDEYAQKDSRIIVIHKKNGGVSSARNVGLGIAKGEWITFIDSDDYILPNFFSQAKGHNEDILFAEFTDLWKGNFSKWCTLEHQIGIGDFLKAYITTPYMRGPCEIFYKKKIIGNIRFHEDMRIGEDACFVFTYFAKCKTLKTLHESDYIVRVPTGDYVKKYALTIEEVNTHITHLHEAFEDLHKAFSIDKSKFFEYIQFYKRISISDWKKKPTLWYLNKTIRQMYRYVWPSLGWKERLRLVGAFLLQR